MRRSDRSVFRYHQNTGSNYRIIEVCGSAHCLYDMCYEPFMSDCWKVNDKQLGSFKLTHRKSWR